MRHARRPIWHLWLHKHRSAARVRPCFPLHKTHIVSTSVTRLHHMVSYTKIGERDGKSIEKGKRNFPALQRCTGLVLHSTFFVLQFENPWLVSFTSSHPALSKKTKETKGLGRSSCFAFRGESNAERRMQSAEWQNAKGRKPERASGKQLCSWQAAADSPSDTSRRWGSVEQSHRCPTQPLSRRCGCHHSATEGQIQWRYG